MSPFYRRRGGDPTDNERQKPTPSVFLAGSIRVTEKAMAHEITPQTLERLRRAIRPERIVETAVRLIEVPSPTRSAAGAAARLEEILRQDGFEVERPEAGWPQSPAVAARWSAPRPTSRRWPIPTACATSPSSWRS